MHRSFGSSAFDGFLELWIAPHANRLNEVALRLAEGRCLRCAVGGKDLRGQHLFRAGVIRGQRMSMQCADVWGANFQWLNKTRFSLKVNFH